MSDSGKFTIDKLLGGTFLFMIYSVIFSLPAFIFFFTISMFTLRSKKLGITQKKLIMSLTNVVDIALNFGALFMLLNFDSVKHEAVGKIPALTQILAFYPVWVLVIVSTLLILLFPFSYNKTVQS